MKLKMISMKNSNSMNIQAKPLGTQMCYSWNDEYGFHQYYCEKISEDVGKIVDFQKKLTKNNIMYSWNDDLGYHMYFAETQ